MKTTPAAPRYPEAICQMCGKVCGRTQELKVEVGYELWCYCEACDIETFHPIPAGPGKDRRR